MSIRNEVKDIPVYHLLWIEIHFRDITSPVGLLKGVRVRRYKNLEVEIAWE
jgi:hypothetical protein